MSEISYLTVGRIVRPHGIKGQVEIVILTDNPQRFEVGGVFQLKDPSAELSEIQLTRIAWKKDRLLAGIQGVDTRDEAEALVGGELMIPESIAEKPLGAHWHHEIIGCEVVTVDNLRLGRVVEILRTGAADVYVVAGERRHMIPATEEIIVSVDIEKSLITIKPLPGLLEL